MKFSTIEEALDELRAGRMIIVVDDEDRENEGDLVIAAEKASTESINFMIRYGRGLVCVPLTASRIEELEIPLMVERNTDKHETAFTVSVDSRKVTTGISAPERALTVKTLIDSSARPEELVRPGHVFPLQAKEGGVLRRAGHTEATVDLCRMAGLYPGGVICEIMNDDGSMARVPQLTEFARQHRLKIITIADLINHRMKEEKLVKRAAETEIPTQFGNFKLIIYDNSLDEHNHVALVMGEMDPEKPTLVRVHSECFTGDVLGSLRCDCGK
ncbi:MAG: 3,4-dihydroxy-2-butanone-4-phosphate synthase, partial [Firmicutes bacterium]|nr:3,4-dihydroxy-2-butanone-4-phosphate synthase [Bacillota bacterium]